MPRRAQRAASATHEAARAKRARRRGVGRSGRTHLSDEDRAKRALISRRFVTICWRRSRMTLWASERRAWSITGSAGFVATGAVAPKRANGVRGTALDAAAARDAVSRIDAGCAAAAAWSADATATAADVAEGVDAASSWSCASRVSMVTMTDEPLRRRSSRSSSCCNSRCNAPICSAARHGLPTTYLQRARTRGTPRDHRRD